MLEVCCDVVENRDCVSDQAGFRGDVRGVVECGEPKAPVVAGQKVSVRDAGDRAIGRWAPTLAEMACILLRH